MNNKNNKFDIVGTLTSLFTNNSDTNYIIRLYNTPPEEFDIEFDKIINEFKENGDKTLIEDFTKSKEILRTQSKLFYKYKKLDEEKEKRTHRSYYLSALEDAFAKQQSEDRKTELLGDIITLQTYIHYTAALIDKGKQSGMITNIYRHLQTHLFDAINDIMAICNFENINIPKEISDDLFNLSIGIDKDYENLIAEASPTLISGFAFGGTPICQYVE